MDGIAFVWRGLNDSEAHRVHAALKETPNILGYTVEEVRAFKRVLVAQNPTGAMVGICVVKDLLGGWSDVAVLLVLPEARGRGIGRALLAEAVEETLRRGRHVYVLSRNPAVIRWMADAGLSLTRSAWRAPLAVHLHMHVHMSSVYRWHEMVRKAKAFPGEHGGFVAGTKKSGPTGPL